MRTRDKGDNPQSSGAEGWGGEGSDIPPIRHVVLRKGTHVGGGVWRCLPTPHTGADLHQRGPSVRRSAYTPSRGKERRTVHDVGCALGVMSEG